MSLGLPKCKLIYSDCKQVKCLSVEGKDIGTAEREKNKFPRVISMCIIISVMMVSWHIHLLKLIRLYILNIYRFLFVNYTLIKLLDKQMGLTEDCSAYTELWLWF